MAVRPEPAGCLPSKSAVSSPRWGRGQWACTGVGAGQWGLASAQARNKCALAPRGPPFVKLIGPRLKNWTNFNSFEERGAAHLMQVQPRGASGQPGQTLSRGLPTPIPAQADLSGKEASGVLGSPQVLALWLISLHLWVGYSFLEKKRGQSWSDNALGEPRFDPQQPPWFPQALACRIWSKP